MRDKPREQRSRTNTDICECVSLNCHGRMIDQHDGRMKCDICQLVVKIPADHLGSLMTKGTP